MKIDIEKIKEILQQVEDLPSFPSEIYFTCNARLRGVKTTPCDNSTIYQCVIMRESGFIVGESMAEGRVFRVDRLTPLGHDVLATLNDKNVWPKLKSIASEIKSIAEFLTFLQP